MNRRPAIAIGASEGGVQAICHLLKALPRDLPAAVFVVVHIGAHPSVMPWLLNHAGTLPAIHPADGDEIRTGHVYVAPPDRHMTVDDGVVRLTRGPRENFARPSIDPLMRSVADHYGPAGIGVILSGGLNDGTAGLIEIKRRGGVAVVQDPADAINASMPRSALAHAAVDHCVPLSAMPQLLMRLVSDLRIASPGRPTASEGLDTAMTHFTFDDPVAITCPDCGGALRQSQLGTLVQFRCHIGHVYTDEVLIDGQFRAMEQSLEAALRAMNERIGLCRQMAGRNGDAATAAGGDAWATAGDEASERAASLRQLLEQEWRRPEQRQAAQA